MILTGETIQDRILGQSQMIEVDTTITLMASGNNLRLYGDLTSRALVSTIDPKMERPGVRNFDRNLPAYIKTHRPELVVAGLTILRAYRTKRGGSVKLREFGGFEEWSTWIRGALIWLGEADPLETQKKIEANDPRKQELDELLSGWKEHFGAFEYTAATVLQCAEEKVTPGKASMDPAFAALIIDLATRFGKTTAKTLGFWLGSHKGDPVNGLRIIPKGKKTNAGQLWKIEKI